jgi:hypothetical protein
VGHPPTRRGKNVKIKGACSFLLEIVFKPWFVFWIAGALMGSIYALTWVRDNILSKELQDKYATQKFLPQWQWQTWLILFLLLALSSVVLNAYRIWKEEFEIRSRYELKPIPELVIGLSTDNKGTVHGIELRNVSQTDNLHNVLVGRSETILGETSWGDGSYAYIETKSNPIACLPFLEVRNSAGKIVGLVRDLCEFGNKVQTMKDAGVVKDVPDRLTIPIKVFAEDSMMLTYMYTAELSCVYEVDYWRISQVQKCRTQRISAEEVFRKHKPRRWPWRRKNG